jgi:hypothetical protein
MDTARTLALARLAVEVRTAMNCAAAAVMFGKPWGAVSAIEADEAEASDYVVVGDRPKTNKAHREALVAGLEVLAAHGAISGRMAGYTADVFASLDRGEADGFALPEPIRGKRRGSVARDQIAAAIADEMHFTVGALDLNREAALSKVTGIKRPGAKGSRQAPTIPLRAAEARRDGKGEHGPYSHARRLLERGEKLLGPVAIANARVQGEAFRRGEPTDARYMRDRGRRLGLLADPAERAWLFRKARDTHNAP